MSVCATKRAGRSDRVCPPSITPASQAGFEDHEESARIYELPSGMVAVVVPATMRVLVSGILITDVVGFIPRFDCSIELCDPTDYPDLIDEIRHNPRTELLNNLLTSETPLRPCQPQGVIVAHGTAFVPHECPDELPVPIEFLLTDERSKELCFKFEVRLDRILRRKHEQRRLKCRERIGWTERTGIFAPARAQVGIQKSGSPKKAINFREASGEDDREPRKAS